jgi:hexosaminidase
MGKRVAVSCFCALSASSLWASGSHSPLLPQPREVQYGPARFPLRGLTIQFGSAPSPEDRFTARELASSLSTTAAASIQVSEAPLASRAITLKRTGPVDALPVPGEQAGPDSREAYLLKVTPGGVELEGRSSAALYSAAQTLRQLVEGTGAGASLPEVEIRDWPSLPYRGVMIDMSHGPLPTKAEIERQLDFMARWKINQYYLYSEASVELKGYPVLSRDARLSREEVRGIVAYARERHIDVVPCVELYGHLHDLFRVERYAHLALIPHGRDFDPRKPEVAALLADWVKQLAELFPSPFFHVGMDETREAPNLAAQDHLQPSALYMDQFRRVSDLVRAHGKTLMVWSDMFARYRELIPKIPPGTIMVPWGYEPSVPGYWKPFAESSLPRFIATGVSIWDQVAPNFERSFDNIDIFLAASRPKGILGLINTIWTDDMAVLIRPAFPGIAYGAASAWQTNPVDRRNFFSDYARIMYPAAAADVATGLDAVGRSEIEFAKAIGGRRPAWDETLPSFWDDPLTPAHLARALAHREHFRQTRLLAEEAGERFTRAIELGTDASTLSDLLLEARLLDYAGMKHLYAADMADFWRDMGAHPKTDQVEFYLHSESATHNHSRIQDLMDTCADLQQAFRAAWMESYTPYRLGSVLGKWDGEFQYWWKLARRFRDYVESYHEGDTLRPLESFSLGY